MRRQKSQQYWRCPCKRAFKHAINAPPRLSRRQAPPHYSNSRKNMLHQSSFGRFRQIAATHTLRRFYETTSTRLASHTRHRRNSLRFVRRHASQRRRFPPLCRRHTKRCHHPSRRCRSRQRPPKFHSKSSPALDALPSFVTAIILSERPSNIYNLAKLIP